MWTTDEEHGKAHRLMREAKQSNDWTSYNQYIDELRKDNEWQDDIRVLADPTDNSGDAYLHVWFINEQGYDAYTSGAITWDELFTDGHIRGEGYYRRTKK